MPRATIPDLLLHLRKTLAIQGARELTDGQLLQLFLDQGEQVAFAVLVHRHGPMVLDVCRRVLGDSHSADDAFQATFMVLCRRMHSIRRKGSVSSWLFGVAKRIAAKEKARMNARRQREGRAMDKPTFQEADESMRQELGTALHEEIDRLPEKYAAPVVLCYLEGKSHEQAAKELGVVKATLTSRLAQARELLRQRLVRRGLSLGSGALAVALSEQTAKAVVPALWTIDITKAAVAMVNGSTLAAAGLSVRAIGLTEETLRASLGFKAKLVLMTLVLGIAGGGGGFAARNGFTESGAAIQAEQPQTPAAKREQSAPMTAGLGVDLYGDPLPEGALARLGTVRFRQLSTSVLAYGLGGNVLISAGLNSGISIWDSNTGKLLNVLSTRADTAAVAANGKTLLTNNFELFDIATGKETGRLQPGGNQAKWVALSPDGRMAAVPGAKAIDGRKAFGPGGKAIPDPKSGSETVVLWDVATCKEIRGLDGEVSYSSFTTFLLFSPDGKSLATCGRGEATCLWDVETGKLLRKFDGKNSNRVAFAPDGKTLATTAHNGAFSPVTIWDVKTGSMLRKLEGSKYSQNSWYVAYSPDGKLLASSNLDSNFLWDVQTGKEIQHWDRGRFGDLVFSPDGKVLAAVEGSTIVRRDAATGKEIDPVAGHHEIIDAVQFSADGKSLLSSSHRERTYLKWDLTSFREQSRVVAAPYREVNNGNVLWSGYILDYNPDQHCFAVVGSFAGGKSDPVVHLRDTRTGNELQSLIGHQEAVRTARFSPDGKFLLSVGKDGCRLWNVATGALVRHLEEAQPLYSLFAISPDGEFVAIARPDDAKTVLLIRISDGKEIHSWDVTERSAFSGLAFSPDGKSLAYGSALQVRVWSVDSSKQLATIDGLKMRWAAFSPDGRILADAISRQGKTSICLWEVLSGQKVRTFENAGVLVESLAFSPDGRTLASPCGDSYILLWDVTDQGKAGKRPPPTSAELNALWVELAQDAAKADGAMWALVLAPERSTPFLKDRLKPTAHVSAEQIAKLIADLDSDRFAVRDKAGKTLEELGEAAEGAIRKALQSQPSLERQRRLALLMERLEKPSGPIFQRLRAIAALEHIGTAQAKAVLESVATADPNTRLGDAAVMSLQRLASRIGAKSNR